jgi:hypothetical protein
VRGIVEFEHDLDHGRSFWHRNPEHGFVVVIKFRSGHVLYVVVGHVVSERQGDVLEFVA